ncbi:hypothetical protein ACWGDX_13015 [Streptomyces sp. NPDC055025]
MTPSRAEATGAALAAGFVQAARAAGASDPQVRGADWQTAVVTAVGVDGTVSIGSIRARRLDTYQGAQVGDMIAITQSGAGNWVALGRLAVTEPLVSLTPITANAATTASTTEVAVITSPSITLKNGRAYRFELRGLVQHATLNTTDLVAFRLRRTSTTGPLIRNLGSVPVTNLTSGARNHAVNLTHIGVNTSGADIGGPVLATYSWDAGSSVTFIFAASTATPATLTITDAGPAAAFAGAGAIT